VPGASKIKVLSDFHDMLDTESLSLRTPSSTFVLSEGEWLLAKALDVESRRADLLEHQVKMLRSELVTVLKRWEVFLVAFLPDLDSVGVTDELRTAIHKERLESLNSLEALRVTRKVVVLPEHAKAIDKLRARNKSIHRQGTRDVVKDDGEDEPTEDSELCLSSGECSIWSSPSEEEDD
jgi:CO dehydrogenase/acetyl-CoA synthase gamma subunit (corrinoid Fe-S protein)